jgi:hypothetical protein
MMLMYLYHDRESYIGDAWDKTRTKGESNKLTSKTPE